MNRLFLLLFGAVTLVADAQVPDYVPTEGLVAWWSFNGTISDPFSSNYSGESYGTEFVEDRFGNVGAALLLDGIDDYVQIEGETTISSFTINIWYKIDDPAFTGYGSLVHIGRDNGVPYCSGFGTGASGNPLELSAHFSCRGFVSPGLSDNSASLNQWTQWVVVYCSSDQNFSFYRNGTHISTVSSPFSESFVSPDPFIYLGCTDPSTIGRFKGNLDDFGLFDRALTEEEILALYNAPAPAPGCTDPAACNYNALAECEGELCDYTCCPGPGCCGEGMYWDFEASQCAIIETCQDDLDGDGVIGVNDLMQLLSSFGTDCPAMFTCGDPVSYHGHNYATVQIGEQCWFAENLRTELYSNGDSILNFSEAQAQGLPLDSNGVIRFNSIDEYGQNYTWTAVSSPLGLCPDSWHVP
ncbi:MAG: FISUMP domain-containing protein, partial [Verrucomicrobia bacterium]|nr:FISUMP domain-containing protein [Verrucomicrobiota bacterium]